MASQYPNGAITLREHVERLIDDHKREDDARFGRLEAADAALEARMMAMHQGYVASHEREHRRLDDATSRLDSTCDSLTLAVQGLQQGVKTLSAAITKHERAQGKWSDRLWGIGSGVVTAVLIYLLLGV